LLLQTAKSEPLSSLYLRLDGKNTGMHAMTQFSSRKKQITGTEMPEAAMCDWRKNQIRRGRGAVESKIRGGSWKRRVTPPSA
jgi:hypothetical protein